MFEVLVFSSTNYTEVVDKAKKLEEAGIKAKMEKRNTKPSQGHYAATQTNLMSGTSNITTGGEASYIHSLYVKKKYLEEAKAIIA